MLIGAAWFHSKRAISSGFKTSFTFATSGSGEHFLRHKFAFAIKT